MKRLQDANGVVNDVSSYLAKYKANGRDPASNGTQTKPPCAGSAGSRRTASTCSDVPRQGREERAAGRLTWMRS